MAEDEDAAMTAPEEPVPPPEHTEASPERTREDDSAASPVAEAPEIETPQDDGAQKEQRNKRFGPPSPGRDDSERRSKRRRSASPGGRRERDTDIYRPDYRREEQPQRRGPPPGRGYGHRDDFQDSHFNPNFRGGPPLQRRMHMPAPEELPYLVPFRQFQSYHQMINSTIRDDKDALDGAYQKYRTDFTNRQLALFFDEHHTKAWFRERYDPHLVDMRMRVKAQGREGKVDQFLASMSANVLTDLSYDLPTAASLAAEAEAEAATTAEDGDATMEEDKTDEAEKADTSALPSKPDHKSDAKEEELVQVVPSPNQLFIKSISPDIERTVLEDHCSRAQGYDYLAISEPNHLRRFQRVGWIAFQSGTDMDAALQSLGESKIQVNDHEQFTLHMQSSKPTHQKIRIAPGIFNEKERLEKDLRQATQLASRLEVELGDNRGSVAIDAHFSALREAAQAAMTELPEESQASIMSGLVKRELDATLLYLRNVFHACYYCTCICDFQEELTQRCPKHVRRQVGTDAPSRKGGDRKRFRQNDQAFVRRLDERLTLLATPDGIDPRDHGGKSPEEELHRLCTPWVKAEEENKYRCQVEGCGKAFRGMNFAEKHISNKHPELVSASLDRIRYFNNYVLDPDRILPPAPDAPPPGAFNGPPPPMSFQGNGPPMNGDHFYGGPPMRNNRDRPLRGGRGGAQNRRENIRAYREEQQRQERLAADLPPPAPPKGVQLDPRANRQRSTYEDLDSAGPPAGELELDY